ncbi:MAG: hypothetical protein AAGG75_06370 [Bacteroidota bacterium]
MNSLTTIDLDNQPLIEQIYGIIDTKIQYIDYQTNRMVNNLIGFDINDVPEPDQEVAGFDNADNAHTNCDSFLTQLEQHSKTKRLLLLMRSYLSELNARIIFELLSNDQFRQFEEKGLKMHLELRMKDR